MALWLKDLNFTQRTELLRELINLLPERATDMVSNGGPYIAEQVVVNLIATVNFAKPDALAGSGGGAKPEGSGE